MKVFNNLHISPNTQRNIAQERKLTKSISWKGNQPILKNKCINLLEHSIKGLLIKLRKKNGLCMEQGYFSLNLLSKMCILMKFEGLDIVFWHFQVYGSVSVLNLNVDTEVVPYQLIPYQRSDTYIRDHCVVVSVWASSFILWGLF